MKPPEALVEIRLSGGLDAWSRQVEIVPGEEMPVMLLAQLADGQVAAYFDESLRQGLVLELMEQMQLIHLPSIDPLRKNLNAHNIPFQVGHYRTNLFPSTFLEFMSLDVECRAKDDPQVQEVGFGDFTGHAYVIERDGEVDSACVSTHENERCGEAWVCTDSQYRHHSLARQVVNAWAGDMLAAGKVPFYSHKIENVASAGLAKHLGLMPAFEEIVISYAEDSSS